MAIGRTFKEALGKGVRGLEIGANGLWRPNLRYQLEDLQVATQDRLFKAYRALLDGHPVEEIARFSGYESQRTVERQTTPS
jgi:hypothetical protein